MSMPTFKVLSFDLKHKIDWNLSIAADCDEIYRRAKLYVLERFYSFYEQKNLNLVHNLN